MIDRVNTVLAKHGLGHVRPGRIVANTLQQVTAAAEAMRLFHAFGGEGWLCTAESKYIFHSAAGGLWPPPDGAWPLHGELARGAVSRHLRRTPRGWTLVTLEENSGVAHLDACLIDTNLHSHQGPELRLHYTVGWEPLRIGEGPSAHEELRPVAYRFTGFATCATRP